MTFLKKDLLFHRWSLTWPTGITPTWPTGKSPRTVRPPRDRRLAALAGRRGRSAHAELGTNENKSMIESGGGQGT